MLVLISVFVFFRYCGLLCLLLLCEENLQHWHIKVDCACNTGNVSGMSEKIIAAKKKKKRIFFDQSWLTEMLCKLDIVL